jgi:hypothetical protein
MHRALIEGQEPPPDDDEPVALFEWRGQEVRILERSSLDPEKQHLDVQYLALEPEGAQVAHLTTQHDYLLLGDLDALFEEVGLSLIAVYGDFEGGRNEDPQQLVLGAELLPPSSAR